MGKKNRQKKRTASDDSSRAGRDEDRFNTQNKPQFHSSSLAEEQSKVVLDERFASVLTDPKFQLDIRDKYGRKKKGKKKKGQKSNNELSAFYSVKEQDDENGSIQSHEHEKEKQQSREEEIDENSQSSQEGQNDDTNDPESTDPTSRIAYLTALSRGELDVSSSSEEESDSDDEEKADVDDDSDSDESDNVMGKVGILDPSYEQVDQAEVELTFEPSRHLAVLNMDWDHVRAVDIYSIIASFTPPGAIEKVQIFPSNFGMERMKKEEQFGPSDLWKKKKDQFAAEKASNNTLNTEASESDDSDDEEDDQKGMQSNAASDSESATSQSDNDENEDIMDDDSENLGDDPIEDFLPKEDHVESDFDPEKLREYEASRLKYYFAVVYLSSAEHADAAYREVDGMEFEHSSAAIDVRAIPPGELESAIKDRPLKDEASGIPSNYEPPEFVVSALQQTNVKCTWEAGDRERDLTLTKYGSSGQDWKAMAESDDIRAYLASDQSSDEEEDSDDGSESGLKGQNKASMMRKMLGLDASDAENESDGDLDKESSDDGNKSADSSDDEDDSDADGEDGAKEMKFIPGSKDLSDKIRSKVDEKVNGKMTPWEKFKLKRKEKKREKKQDARERRQEINKTRRHTNGGDSDTDAEEGSTESFLIDGNGRGMPEDLPKAKKPIDRAELELLVAGDEDDENARDYDMRGLQRIDKNKGKKLRGARKRKEAELASAVTGQDFKMNLQDDRFKMLMDGQDDRFGIDRTDPNFKDTQAMRDVMAEQSRRRRKKRKKQTSKSDDASGPKKKSEEAIPKDVVAGDSSQSNSGASALSSLVSRLKSKVQK